MEVKWSFPKFKHGLNPPAIYRMDFDTGHYYIGSSKKVKTRMNNWRTIFKYDRFSSKLLADTLKSVKEVKFIIIEHPALGELLERENYHLNLHFDNPLLVNRSSSAYGNIGLKPLPSHLVKYKQRPKKPPKPPKGKFKPSSDHVYAFSKGVVQFDLQGNYIQSHKSISDAAKAIGVKMKYIQENLNVKRHKKGVKGFVFKFCGDNSPVELLIRGTPIISENAGKVKSKVVVDVNTGEKITVEIAAQRLGVTKKYFYKIISESDGKVNNTPFRYNGEYIWKYADAV